MMQLKMGGQAAFQGALSRQDRGQGTSGRETRLEMSRNAGGVESYTPRPVCRSKLQHHRQPVGTVYKGNSLHFYCGLHYLLCTLVFTVPELCVCLHMCVQIHSPIKPQTETAPKEAGQTGRGQQ